MTDLDADRVRERIEEALDAAAAALEPYTPGAVEAEYKSPGDPVTEADRAVNEALHRALWRRGEGWLSEESADDFSRLAHERLWIVDPLDGTREFVAGIPEWCVSVAWVVRGRPLAGGILNPSTGESFLGSLETGLEYNGVAATASRRDRLEGAVVLASRSEVKRGEWKRFEGAPFTIRPMGSVAYKLACVAAGLADATWTLTPKHEWDVAAGVALAEAAGAEVWSLSGTQAKFNQRPPLIPGLVACGRAMSGCLAAYLRPHVESSLRFPSPLFGG